MSEKAWHEKTQTERHADIIHGYETRHRAQVGAISRLVSVVPLSKVPDATKTVLFKLTDGGEMFHDNPPSDMVNTYLEIDQSTVDSDGRVIVTLKAVDSPVVPS
jgi:hypothetical protein